MTDRRKRQSRAGQKFTAKPSDLRTRGKNGPVVTTTDEVLVAMIDLMDMLELIADARGNREQQRFLYGKAEASWVQLGWAIDG